MRDYLPITFPRGGLTTVTRPVVVVALGAMCLGVSGCGTSRTRPPSLAAAAQPNGFRALSYPSVGLSLHVPRDWSVLPGRRPLVATISSGPAVVALWRYARNGPLANGAALQHALQLLLRAARARDPGLRLVRARALRVDHAPAVEIDAFERVSGEQRRVRSTHVYLRGREIVLEEYAPVASFHLVDHLAFSPIKNSLTFGSAGSPPR